MTDPLPLEDVLGIVERRRRRRARVQGAVAPALSVAAVGVAGLVVVAVQAGPDRAVPAAPGVSDLPVPPPVAAAPPATPTTRPGAPPVDPGFLRPDFLPALALTLTQSATSVGEPDRALTDAEDLARVWGLGLDPAAKAVVAKAGLTGVPVDPRDAQGDDVLADRFAEAGFTSADAAALAEVWRTDPRTAAVVGGLLVEAGLAGG